MKQTFGAFLKEKRQEKKLTQKQLADILFVSESAVSKWEKDVAHPDITLLPKLSETLEVSEHELITASIDNQSREEKAQAKKWRIFSKSWSCFFYIAYVVALIPCFICNLAIDKTLSWFWIVVSALLLSFTFTNLPKLIKKDKLIWLPLCMFLALCLLLGVCAIYSKGDWFLIATFPVLFGLTIIFAPIYISKYAVFSKIKKYADFIALGVDFIMLNILLIIADVYAVQNGYAVRHWYFSIGLPIALSVYLILNVLVSVRLLKINRFLKTSVVLSLIAFFTYILPLVIKVENLKLQKEINQINIFKADFSNWKVDVSLENNVHCIVFLTLLFLALVFLGVGLLRWYKKKK